MALWISLLFTGLLMLGVGLFFRSQRSRNLARSHGCQAPRKYPHVDPFLGLDGFIANGKMFAENTFFPENHRRFQTYGKTFEMKYFHKRDICSIEPQDLQSVFASNAKNWGVSYRLPAMDPYCGRGFLTTDGAEWQQSKQLFNEALSKSNIRDCKTYDHYLTLMMRKLPRDGTTVDLQELTFSLYMDTSTLLLFGESSESLSQGLTDEAKVFVETFNKSFEGAGLRMGLGPLMFLHRDPAWHAANARNHEFVMKFVDKARMRARSKADQDHTRPVVLIDLMAEQIDDPIQLRNEVTHAYVAANETTACLISSLMWALARKPDIWNQLRAEALAIEGELTFDKTLKSQHLQRAINETLRLYTVFPYHMREAASDCTLPVGGGEDGLSPIFVQAGTRFEGHFSALHVDPKTWGPDSHEFHPDRWHTVQPKTWEFAPFGGGSRSCAGKQKALMETSFYVTRMLREFSAIEARDDRDWVGKVQITAKNLYGCKVALTPA